MMSDLVGVCERCGANCKNQYEGNYYPCHLLIFGRNALGEKRQARFAKGSKRTNISPARTLTFKESFQRPRGDL